MRSRDSLRSLKGPSLIISQTITREKKEEKKRKESVYYIYIYIYIYIIQSNSLNTTNLFLDVVVLRRTTINFVSSCSFSSLVGF